MPLSDARKRANKKWNDANMADRYDRINLVVPRGQKATIQTAADKRGESLNMFMQRAALARMGLESWPNKSDEINQTGGE